MAWEGEGDFRGDHLIFGRTKGGSVLTENPKAVIAENFGRIRGGGGGALNLAWKMKPGVIAKVIKRHHFSEVTFKGGIG